MVAKQQAILESRWQSVQSTQKDPGSECPIASIFTPSMRKWESSTLAEESEEIGTASEAVLESTPGPEAESSVKQIPSKLSHNFRW